MALTLGLTVTSCDDFLDRPAEDGYNTGNYYQNDSQCYAGVDYLYNAPWYDFQRGFILVGEGLSGNYIQGSMSTNYINFTLNGSDENLTKMSASLWSVIAHANTVYNNLKNCSGPSQAVKNQCMGECLTWKALAYFFLVRSFGEVPIVHDNGDMLASGAYSTCEKVKRDDVFEYITMTLEKAMQLLPEKAAEGRLDYYSAKGLLAKTYLTRAGVSGKFNKEYLDEAARLAREVIKDSNFKLEDDYENIFLLSNRYNKEGMIVWRWTSAGTNWCRQNSLHSDIGLMGMMEMPDCWGDWGGFTPDCQLAFGADLVNKQPDSWINNTDTRLHATMMLPGFKYDQFWQDKGGFDYLKAMYGYMEAGSDYRLTNEGVQSCTGSNTVKHIFGNAQDHKSATGAAIDKMASSVPTFILRFSDMYLILAEAKTLLANIDSPLNAETDDEEAVNAYYEVHHRAVKNAKKPGTVSFMDIWKERRLEFCMEGDRWYDYVRLSYVEPEFCKAELENQNRWEIWNLAPLYEEYYKTGNWDPAKHSTMYRDNFTPITATNLMKVDADSGKPYFIIPPYTGDVNFNGNMGLQKDGVHVDVRSRYNY